MRNLDALLAGTALLQVGNAAAGSFPALSRAPSPTGLSQAASTPTCPANAFTQTANASIQPTCDVDTGATASLKSRREETITAFGDETPVPSIEQALEDETSTILDAAMRQICRYIGRTESPELQPIRDLCDDISAGQMSEEIVGKRLSAIDLHATGRLDGFQDVAAGSADFRKDRETLGKVLLFWGEVLDGAMEGILILHPFRKDKEALKKVLRFWGKVLEGAIEGAHLLHFGSAVVRFVWLAAWWGWAKRKQWDAEADIKRLEVKGRSTGVAQRELQEFRDEGKKAETQIRHFILSFILTFATDGATIEAAGQLCVETLERHRS